MSITRGMDKEDVVHIYSGILSEWAKSLSRVQLFVTPWTVAHQVPPSMGFSRQEYWSGLSSPSPGDLPDPGIEPWSPTLSVSSVSQSCPTLRPHEPQHARPPCPSPTAGGPSPTQTHDHWVGDAIQPSHSLSSPSSEPPGKSNNGILLSQKGEQSKAIYRNVDGPRDYHTKRNKSNRERQILYDITHIWNLIFKDDINELICKTEPDVQIPKTNLWLPKGKGGRGEG